MRRVVFVMLAIAIPAASVFGGKIFGDIRIADKPIGEGIRVTISLPKKSADTTKAPVLIVVDSTVTDKLGSYRLVIREEGKCVLTVYYVKDTLTFEAFSYKEAQRYDLKMEKIEGKYALKRR